MMEPRRWISGLTPALLIGALAACDTPDEQPPPEDAPAGQEPGAVGTQTQDPGATGMQAQESQARAMMINSDGDAIGVVTFSQENGGVRVSGEITLPEAATGPKGFHVHENGDCQAPSFESAGGHFDPHDRPHGGPDDPPEERHVGDLGNIEVGGGGTARIELVDEVIALEGDNAIVGRALMIHEQQDDTESQPTGDAGPRLACGVIER